MSAPAAKAQESLNLLINAGNTAGYAKADQYSAAATVGKIINVSLGIIGVLFLGLMVYAGYLWLTAGGDEEQVKKAKSYMYNSLIGLVIVLASYGLSNYIVSSIIISAG